MSRFGLKMWFKKIILLLFLLNPLISALRVLGVAPIAAPSHFIQISRLLRELAARGHQVDVISMYPRKSPLENYTDYAIDVVPDYFLANSATYEDSQRFAKLTMDFFAKYAGSDVCDYMACPNVQKVLQKGKGAYDVIIVELFMAYCYLALGRHFDAPMIGFISLKSLDWIYSPFASPIHPGYIPSTFSPSTQYMDFWERVHNTVLTNFLKYQVDHLVEAQVPQVEKYLGRKLSSIHELFDDVSMLFINSHTSLDTIRPLTPDIIEIAGLHVIDDQDLGRELEMWLDESTSGIVYFTFGSMVLFETFPLEIIEIFYEMFRRITPVRVLMRIGDASKLPPGLPENVRTSRWLPQIAILKHRNTKAFITHGGLCSTQEAIAHRVPMIGVPLFIDQHPNVEYLVRKKVAIQVLIDDKLTADSLTMAVHSILTDPAYRNNIARLSDLYWDRPINALDTAVFWVEYTARHGPVLKSPSLKLTWWQFYLLDVYGFIIICLLLAIYIFYKIITLLWHYLGSMIAHSNDNSNHGKVD